MSNFLGIDTSNYTTSVAFFDNDNNTVVQRKKLLPVKKGEKGIRQSDAVFHHTVQLPEITEELFSSLDNHKIDGIGVSFAPRRENGSYMPCFLAGVSAAKVAALSLNVPLFELSHQEGHITAALYSAGRLDLLNHKFIAFHISGGTTEALLCSPDSEYVFSSRIVAKSLDLKAGQAVDRVGLMLGLDFPAGVELEKLSEKSNVYFNIRASMKQSDCSLSGIENKCKTMFEKGSPKEDVALFCIDSIISALDSMLSQLISDYGNLPVVFSGGVSSNKRIRNFFQNKYDAVFAEPVFSADNAAGVAVLASVKFNRCKNE